MQKINFHKFLVGDVEDPEVIVGSYLGDWLKTNHGSWVQQHAHNLFWTFCDNDQHYGYEVQIRGELTDSDATHYLLKYGNTEDTV